VREQVEVETLVRLVMQHLHKHTSQPIQLPAKYHAVFA
jgi:hypothetical protein